MKGLEGFIVEDERTLRLQPATSPVWDTAWAVHALSECGLPANHPALVRAGHWLLGQEIRKPRRLADQKFADRARLLGI